MRVHSALWTAEPDMDRDEEVGHGDRSLLFIGDEDDLGVDRDGGSPPTSSDDGSFSDRSDAETRAGHVRRRDGGEREDAPDEDGQNGAWPQSYRFVNQPPRRPHLFHDSELTTPFPRRRSRFACRQSIDMLSAVPSPTMNSIMAASPSLTRFGSSFLKAGSSFFLRKGEGSGLPLTRPLLPPSLPQLSQSSLHPQPRPVKQSTDSLIAQPPRWPAAHEAELPERPSRQCLKSDYIELPPPASKCSRNQSIINGA
jgi:solute carrier family 32 (vesicular inhibitory amino acid transporter)